MPATSAPAQVIWFFGPPCAGKTTLANALRRSLGARGVRTSLLDEADLAAGLNSDLPDAERDSVEATRRTAHSALMIACQGVPVIVTTSCQTEEHRGAVRSVIDASSLKMVFIDCLPEVLADRAESLNRPRPGDFERPQNSDLTVKTHVLTPDDCLRRVERLLPAIMQSAAREEDSTDDDFHHVDDHHNARNAFSQDWEELRKLSQIRAKNERPPDLTPKPPRKPPAHILPFWMRVSPATVFNVLFLIGGIFLLSFLVDRVSNNYDTAKSKTSLPDKTPFSNQQDAAEPRKLPVPGELPKFQSPAGPAILLPKTDETASSSPQSPPESSKDSANTQTLLVPRAAPADASIQENQARGLIERYWTLKAWKDKVPLVYQASRVEALMRGFYEADGGADVPGKKHLETSFKSMGDLKIICLRYSAPDGFQTMDVVFREAGNGELKLDWESLVGAGELPWTELQAKRPTKPTLLRAYISAADYYNYEFTDENALACLRLDSPGNKYRVFAYAARSSPVGIQGESMARLGLARGVVVKVAYPPDAQSDHAVQLIEIVSDQWLIP